MDMVSAVFFSLSNLLFSNFDFSDWPSLDLHDTSASGKPFLHQCTCIILGVVARTKNHQQKMCLRPPAVSNTLLA
jgi:hypothetical protein